MTCPVSGANLSPRRVGRRRGRRTRCSGAPRSRRVCGGGSGGRPGRAWTSGTSARSRTAAGRRRDLLVDPAQRAPGPVGLVLVVDDLVAALVGRGGGPGLGQDQPVGHLLIGVAAAPFGNHVRDL